MGCQRLDTAASKSHPCAAINWAWVFPTDVCCFHVSVSLCRRVTPLCTCTWLCVNHYTERVFTAESYEGPKHAPNALIDYTSGMRCLYIVYGPHSPFVYMQSCFMERAQIRYTQKFDKHKMNKFKWKRKRPLVVISVHVLIFLQ